MEKTLSNSRPLECDGNAQAERQEPLASERKALLECAVAGIGFHDIDDVWDELYVGAKIALVRERCNKYDRNAVAVALAGDYDGGPDDFDFNFILGYIPRTCNSAIAAILDMGHGDIIEAKISEMNDHAPYPERLHITSRYTLRPRRPCRQATTACVSALSRKTAGTLSPMTCGAKGSRCSAGAVSRRGNSTCRKRAIRWLSSTRRRKRPLCI